VVWPFCHHIVRTKHNARELNILKTFLLYRPLFPENRCFEHQQQSITGKSIKTEK
jgi:hypothetical protein